MGLFNLQYAAAYAKRAAVPSCPFFASRHLLYTALYVLLGSIAAISSSNLPSLWAWMKVWSSSTDHGRRVTLSEGGLYMYSGHVSSKYSLSAGLPDPFAFALRRRSWAVPAGLPPILMAVTLWPARRAATKAASSSSVHRFQRFQFSAHRHQNHPHRHHQSSCRPR